MFSVFFFLSVGAQSERRGSGHGGGRKDSMSTNEMNGGDSPCGSDGSGWGFGSPAAVDWSVCTPCAKPFDAGPSQLSSSEFSSQQLPGSVGSGGSGWGVVFQQTPVGAGDMDLARSKSNETVTLKVGKIIRTAYV